MTKTQTHNEPNRLKQAILEVIFHRHLHLYDIAILTYKKCGHGKPFQAYYKNIAVTVSRMSKEYNPNKSRSARGYSIPYISRRISLKKNPRNAKKVIHEYKASKKGRRMVCEWRLRDDFQEELKWDGGYFINRDNCKDGCDSCLCFPDDPLVKVF